MHSQKHPMKLFIWAINSRFFKTITSYQLLKFVRAMSLQSHFTSTSIDFTLK